MWWDLRNDETISLLNYKFTPKCAGERSSKHETRPIRRSHEWQNLITYSLGPPCTYECTLWGLRHQWKHWDIFYTVSQRHGPGTITAQTTLKDPTNLNKSFSVLVNDVLRKNMACQSDVYIHLSTCKIKRAIKLAIKLKIIAATTSIHSI